MIVFRNTDVDVAFFWEDDSQPEARWHGPGDGPAQYTSSTPDASWAEFLRHQGIDDPADLVGVERAMWAIEIPDDEPEHHPTLPTDVLTGDLASHGDCQNEARRLRAMGASRLATVSAAVLPDAPSGCVTDSGLAPGPARDEQTIVLFGPRPGVVGWLAAAPGRPAASLLPRVRQL